MIDVIPFLENLFPPDADLLLDQARRLADDESLREIAGADYGEQSDEMYVLLRSICDTGKLPSAFPFQLHEVLSLSRWHDPESPGNPARGGLAGHKKRLLAVAVLLEAAAERSIDDVGFDSTLAMCLQSARALGDEITSATGRFLTWWVQKNMKEPPEWRHESAFLAVGLLLCVNRCSDISDEHLRRIADWVLAVDACGNIHGIPAPGSPEPPPFSIAQGFWKPLANELRSRAERIPAGAARTSLECCALLLDSGW